MIFCLSNTSNNNKLSWSYVRISMKFAVDIDAPLDHILKKTFTSPEDEPFPLWTIYELSSCATLKDELSCTEITYRGNCYVTGVRIKGQILIPIVFLTHWSCASLRPNFKCLVAKGDEFKMNCNVSTVIICMTSCAVFSREPWLWLSAGFGFDTLLIVCSND